MKHKVIIGLTGASGMIYGKRLLEKLMTLQEQIQICSVILSEHAREVWEYEIGSFESFKIPFHVYELGNLFAPMASGSSGYDSMIICPCTMGTLGRIASGIATDLMTRAADVILKERKKLILVPREAPYNMIHLNNMKIVADAGAVICPASPSFYSKPASLEELIMTIVDRVLLLTSFEIGSYHWGE